MRGKKRRLQRMITSVPTRGIEITAALDEFVLALKAANRSPVTVKGYRKTVNRFARWLTSNGHPTDLAQLQATHIRLWLGDLQARDGLRDISVQTYFREIRAFFNFAEREELIESSPFKAGRLPTPKATRRIKASYTQDELQALIRSCETGEHHRRDLAIVLLLLDTGIRAAELCGLRLADVERGRIKVLGKGAKERYALTTPRTDAAIRAYLRHERYINEDDAREAVTLFLGRQGPLTTSGLLQIIKRRCRQVGIKGWGIHKMRHTWAMMTATSGMPLHALQTLLGHTTPAMSLKYGRLASDQAQVAELHRQHSPVERLGMWKRRKG